MGNEICGEHGLDMITDEVLQRFLLACKRSEALHPDCGVQVVYHWTPEANLAGIRQKGLLVGDRSIDSAVTVANGQALGPGIYVCPNYQSIYGQYGDSAIICLALPGAESPFVGTGPLCECASIYGRGFGKRTLFSHTVRNTPKHFSRKNYAGDDQKAIVYRHNAQVLACSRLEPDQIRLTMQGIEACLVLLDAHFPGLGIFKQSLLDLT